MDARACLIDFRCLGDSEYFSKTKMKAPLLMIMKARHYNFTERDAP